MLEVFGQITDIFKSYSENSIYMTLFLCALFYLWMTEEEKGKRIVLIYASACVLGMFFFPVSAYLLINTAFDGETYYRILWFLPVCIGIAYGTIHLISRQKKVGRKIVLTILACVILINGGDYTYDNPTFEKAENAYHIPQSVIDVCDAIRPTNQDGWVCAVVPQEFLSYVRQYDTNIHLPYGREVLIPRWNQWHPMYQTMEADIIYAKTLAKQAREDNCQYIILNEKKVFDEDIEQYHFKLVDTIDGYHIYLDTDNSMGVVYTKKTEK